MIVSHKHRFIYIKTLKTAGTSLEIALSKFCGPHDVITQIDSGDEATRAAISPRGAQNFRPRLAHLVRDLRLSVRSDRGVVKFFNHMPATMVRERVSADVWHSYFKFTTARHPLDLAFSLFYWRRKSEPSLRDMGAFLRRYGSHLYRNTEIVSENEMFLLDDFVRYEHFEEDLTRIGKRISLPEDLWTVFKGIQAKGGVRAKGSLAEERLSSQEHDIVRFLCEKQYEFYGYN